MGINRVIDAMAGDEHSKKELKIAYKKAFRLGLWTSAVLSMAIFIILFSFFFPAEIAIEYILYLGLCIIPPLVIGSMVGSISLSFFTKHLKITLPETIAPRVELVKKSN